VRTLLQIRGGPLGHEILGERCGALSLQEALKKEVLKKSFYEAKTARGAAQI
jgi:hypothetical protein